MENFFSYLNSTEEDKNWGLYLTVGGHQIWTPGLTYPSKEHPSAYYFDWNFGRILDEYQLIYISSGQGNFEINNKLLQVNAGDILRINPNQKHRFRPVKSIGWTENYIGFKGHLAAHFMNLTFQDLQAPIISCGLQSELLQQFQRIFDIIRLEKPGFQQHGAAKVLELISLIRYYANQHSENYDLAEQLVQHAKAYMHEHIDKNIVWEEFSRKQTVSYSLFRKLFKRYTGTSPHQYFINLKMMRAKALMLSTDLSIKEITYQLGFESIHYFSRIFKLKIGLSPTAFRKKRKA